MTREEIKLAKEYADLQYYPAAASGEFDACVGFEFDGRFIVHPWIDQTGRFELPTEKVIEIYGKENFEYFCREIIKENSF